MLKHKLARSWVLIVVTVIVYAAIGLISNKWHTEALLAFLVGIFIAADDTHPRLRRAGFILQVTAGDMLNQLLRAEWDSKEPGAPQPTLPFSHQSLKAMHWAYLSYLELDDLSWCGKSIHTTMKNSVEQEFFKQYPGYLSKF